MTDATEAHIEDYWDGFADGATKEKEVILSYLSYVIEDKETDFSTRHAYITLRGILKRGGYVERD